jgi:predicted histidine transporter YuiF (NhaC family)
MEEKKLYISLEKENQIFKYGIIGNEEIHISYGLVDLISRLKKTNISYLIEKPIYNKINEEDREILEGIRKKLITDDLDLECRI